MTMIKIAMVMILVMKITREEMSYWALILRDGFDDVVMMTEVLMMMMIMNMLIVIMMIMTLMMTMTLTMTMIMTMIIDGDGGNCNWEEMSYCAAAP